MKIEGRVRHLKSLVGFGLRHLFGTGLKQVKRHPPGLELQDAIQEQAELVQDSGGWIKGLRLRVQDHAGPAWRTVSAAAP